MSLATTIKESRSKRKQYVLAALYHRSQGNRLSKIGAMNHARIEWMNSKYFLGPSPF